MKLNLFVCFVTILVCDLKAQDLTMRKLTTEDKSNKIIGKYEYNAKGHYGIIKLSLFSNGVFRYELALFNKDVFSEGKWIQKKDTLILNSTITNNHIPIKLIYSNDSSNLIDGFKIAIVRNLKGDYLRDGMVNINNDSIKCVPEGGFCTVKYETIDSLKIVFENGLYSNWIKVTGKKYASIIPIVQTKFLIASYEPLDNRKYLFLKSRLRPIN